MSRKPDSSRAKRPAPFTGWLKTSSWFKTSSRDPQLRRRCSARREHACSLFSRGKTYPAHVRKEYTLQGAVAHRHALGLYDETVLTAVLSANLTGLGGNSFKGALRSGDPPGHRCQSARTDSERPGHAITGPRRTVFSKGEVGSAEEDSTRRPPYFSTWQAAALPECLSANPTLYTNSKSNASCRPFRSGRFFFRPGDGETERGRAVRQGLTTACPRGTAAAAPAAADTDSASGAAAAAAAAALTALRIRDMGTARPAARMRLRLRMQLRLRMGLRMRLRMRMRMRRGGYGCGCRGGYGCGRRGGYGCGCGCRRRRGNGGSEPFFRTAFV